MRRTLATLAALALLAVLAPGALADEGVSGWDGTNPFACTLQQVGTGTAFPQPGADPFCVEFDKTHQNVSQLGVVDFLSQEPARVAAASDKCFYFQRDHWRGSLVQDNAATETYTWDGSYFFDKARGLGGAYVENFRVAGQAGDPTALPGFPADYKPYFGNGRGGVQRTGSVQADPRCVGKPSGAGASGGGSGHGGDRCRVPGGYVGQGIGGVTLGMRRSAARDALGLPTRESARYATWCFSGGGRLVVGFRSASPRSRAAFVLTDAEPFDTHGIRRGTPRRTARRKLRHERTLLVKGRTRVLMVVEHRRRLLVGLGGRKVTFLAIAPRKIRRARLAGMVRGF
jgi:hypothetical protein